MIISIAAIVFVISMIYSHMSAHALSPIDNSCLLPHCCPVARNDQKSRILLPGQS